MESNGKSTQAPVERKKGKKSFSLRGKNYSITSSRALLPLKQSGIAWLFYFSLSPFPPLRLEFVLAEAGKQVDARSLRYRVTPPTSRLLRAAQETMPAFEKRMGDKKLKKEEKRDTFFWKLHVC